MMVANVSPSGMGQLAHTLAPSVRPVPCSTMEADSMATGPLTRLSGIASIAPTGENLQYMVAGQSGSAGSDAHA